MSTRRSRAQVLDLLGYDVPAEKKIRLIIDTDAKNEADDQYAIVHALLTPRFDICGIVGAHFGVRAGRDTVQDSVREVAHLLDLMGMSLDAPVVAGGPGRLTEPPQPSASPGAELIVAAAMGASGRPLFAIFLGPLTDLATAVLLEPRIADRLTAVWIGGGPYPDGGDEFNLGNDIVAANVVFDSAIPLWQIPKDVYASVRVGLAELSARIRPHGRIGAYLVDQLLACNAANAHNPHWPPGEAWALGDSPAVSILLDDHWMHRRAQPAPQIAPDGRYQQRPDNPRHIEVLTQIDARFTLEDLSAKLALTQR